MLIYRLYVCLTLFSGKQLSKKALLLVVHSSGNNAFFLPIFSFLYFQQIISGLNSYFKDFTPNSSGRGEINHS